MTMTNINMGVFYILPETNTEVDVLNYTRVVPKVMNNFFCMRTENSRRRRVRW